MSTPFVAGAIALLLNANSSFKGYPGEVLKILPNATRIDGNITNWGSDQSNIFGWGKLNTSKLIAYGKNCSHWIGPPGEFSFTTTAESPDNDGNYYLNWSTAVGADYFNLYSYLSPIIEINDSISLIFANLENNSIQIENSSDGIIYWKIVAVNEYSSRSSDCLRIQVIHGSPPSFPPGNFSLFISTLTGVVNSQFGLNWTSAEGATNYSLYVYSGPISSINSSLSLIATGILNSSYFAQESTVGTYYFVAVAFNNSGLTLSNCVSITIFPQNSTTTTNTSTSSSATSSTTTSSSSTGSTSTTNKLISLDLG